MKRGNGLRSGGFKRSKRINPYGKVAKARSARRKQWIEDHPPQKDQFGNLHYDCHICVYFGEAASVATVLFDRFVLEHIDNKGHLSLEESERDDNLAPAHGLCNIEKGSLPLELMERSPISGLPNPHARTET